MGKGRKITRALRWTYWVFRWRRSARLLQHASDVACWRCRRALSSKTSAYSSCASTHEFLCPSTHRKIGRLAHYVAHRPNQCATRPLGSPLPEDLSSSPGEHGRMLDRQSCLILLEFRTEASS